MGMEIYQLFFNRMDFGEIQGVLIPTFELKLSRIVHTDIRPQILNFQDTDTVLCLAPTIFKMFT